MTRRHFFSIVSAVATGILVVVKGYGQKPRTASSSPDAEASASKKCGMPEATDADVTFERGRLKWTIGPLSRVEFVPDPNGPFLIKRA